jgi:hypothetical protein
MFICRQTISFQGAKTWRTPSNPKKPITQELLDGFRNGELLGFLFGSIEEYWFTKERGANMIVWYVAKEARGSTMAIKLLLAFRGWAQNRQATELTLSITSGLNTEKTGRFLRRMGFRPCGENFYQPLPPIAADPAAGRRVEARNPTFREDGAWRTNT